MLRALALPVALAISCASSNAEPPGPAPVRAEAPPPSVPAGPRADGPGFLVEVTPPAQAAVGAEAAARVVLHPKAGYHVNKEFPMVLDVTAPAGVEMSKARQTSADAAKLAEEEAAFDVRFVGKDAGAKQFQATFKFAVCTATTCDPKKERLAWNVVVK